jgi:hypothetical protein
MIKSGLDIRIAKDDFRTFSVSDLVKLCENQNDLLNDDDRLIERLTTQLSEYVQELYDKDIHIGKLEYELRRTQRVSSFDEDLL